jgi:hypothetical protein
VPKNVHILRDVTYVFEVEDGVNQMNASITMLQEGQSKKMAEAR